MNAGTITIKSRKQLKPCPFCGSAGELHKTPRASKLGYDAYLVECSNDHCPVSLMCGWWYDTAVEAAKAWNRRASEQE